MELTICSVSGAVQPAFPHRPQLGSRWQLAGAARRYYDVPANVFRGLRARIQLLARRRNRPRLRLQRSGNQSALATTYARHTVTVNSKGQTDITRVKY